MSLPIGTDARFTATGPFGNLVLVVVAYDEGGSNLVITVADTYHITLTIGTTASVPNITWAAMATLFNADPDASAVCFMEGAANSNVPIGNGGALLTGSYGIGEGQFFSADATPPPGNTVTANCTMAPCTPATSTR